jgi:hypothetical protein
MQVKPPATPRRRRHGDLHGLWRIARAHAAADWLRDFTAKAVTDLAAVDDDKKLSFAGKADKKKLLAKRAKPANLAFTSRLGLHAAHSRDTMKTFIQ